MISIPPWIPLCKLTCMRDYCNYKFPCNRAWHNNEAWSYAGEKAIDVLTNNVLFYLYICIETKVGHLISHYNIYIHSGVRSRAELKDTVTTSGVIVIYLCRTVDREPRLPPRSVWMEHVCVCATRWRNQNRPTIVFTYIRYLTDFEWFVCEHCCLWWFDIYLIIE